MNHIVLYAQFVGAFATICMFITFQMNDRKKILFVQIINSIAWIIHYLMLSAMSGVVINVVCFIRNLIFQQRGKKKWADSNLIPIVTCALEILLTVMVWKDGFDVLACTAASLQTTSLWMKEPKKIRIFSFIASPIWIVYDLHHASYVGILTEVITMTSLIIAAWRYDRK
ncbi:MAG: YgjV family protein [Eubacterium sp.]|nr:YgjV family protein [Eubacterium sp.]